MQSVRRVVDPLGNSRTQQIADRPLHDRVRPEMQLLGAQSIVEAQLKSRCASPAAAVAATAAVAAAPVASAAAAVVPAAGVATRVPVRAI
jgi:hypothetical protein